MSRDRSLALVLALLLLASLAANVVLWQRSHRSPLPPAVAAKPDGRINGPRDGGAAGVHEVVPNPELQGRLGRLVLGFAEGVKPGDVSTRTVVYKQGGSEQLHSAYGPATVELVSGTYDLEVSGKKLAAIPVKAGHDTRIPSGVLRTHGAKETRFVVYDVGGTETLHSSYGNAQVGLPAGDYEVEVSGQREKIAIAAGKVTDF